MNPELQGRVFAPTPPYLVGREKVREFARAVLADSPLSLDVLAARAAGYDDLVAPPTFPAVIQEFTLHQLLDEPDAGIDFTRVVHGDQRFTYSRPIVRRRRTHGHADCREREDARRSRDGVGRDIHGGCRGRARRHRHLEPRGQGRRMTLAVGDVVAEKTYQLTRDTPGALRGGVG